MNNYENFLNAAKSYVTKCDVKLHPFERENANIRVREKTFGNYKFLLREIINNNKRTSFFVFNIVETTDPDKVNLTNCIFEIHPHIKRMIKISGDRSYGNVVIKIDYGYERTFDGSFINGSSIIIKPDNEYGIQYKKNGPEIEVNVELILSYLLNGDYNRLFGGIPQYIKSSSGKQLLKQQTTSVKKSQLNS